MNEIINSMVDDLEYDGKFGHPVRFHDFCQKATQIMQFVPADKKEQYLTNLEAMATPDILSFGDQLSKENADKLKDIKAGCNQALTVIYSQSAPVVEQEAPVMRQAA